LLVIPEGDLRLRLLFPLRLYRSSLMVILATSRSPRHSFSKQVQPSLRLIAGEGVEGDAHRGATVQHLYDRRKDPDQPNRSQVHLLAAELLAELAAKGFAIGPGELGENILTQGIDLLALPAATLLHLGTDAVVEVTGLRTPCVQIDRLRTGLQKHLWGMPDDTGEKTRRAGIMSIVLHGGLVHPGDLVRVELPPLPHRPLAPV
jgi:MOSC domain-containing protein YiiM